MSLGADSTGVYSIAVTPFDETGQIDFGSIGRLIDFYVDSGVDGLTILGILGEAQKLSEAEAVEFAKAILQRAGNLPIVVGVSAPGFASMSNLAKAAMEPA